MQSSKDLNQAKPAHSVAGDDADGLLQDVGPVGVCEWDSWKLCKDIHTVNPS